MSFSGSESYSGLLQSLEMELLTIFEAFQGSKDASVIFSLTGEIFTQKSDNLFNKKKKGLPQLTHL